MLKKYKELANKATAFEIIDNRALILLGDSAEILKDTGCNADRMITDPPYEFNADGGKKFFGREKSAFNTMRGLKLADGFDLKIFEYCKSVSSVIVFFHQDQLFDLLKTLTQPRGEDPPLYNRYMLGSWHKSNPTPVANKNYVPDTECYIHAWNLPKFYPQGALNELSRYIVTPVIKSKYSHPTVKPQVVMEKMIINGSFQGDHILDPFSGSGSTGVAAVKLGRYYIGIEKNPEFYHMSIDRLKVATGVGIPDEGDQLGLF